MVLPVGMFKGCLEESGISPRKEKNKRLMGKAGETGRDGGKGWKQGEQECFVPMQGGRVGYKENISLGEKKMKSEA